MLFHCFCPNGVVRSAVKTSLAVAVRRIGLLGAIAGGFLLASIACRNWITETVLAAAPFNFIRIGPEIFGFTSRMGPPEYSNITSLNEQSTHSSPSNVSRPGPPKELWVNTLPDNGFTIGSQPSSFKGPPWVNTGCATVDVWLPESAKNAVATPSANDTNAVVTLDIAPPSEFSGRNCAVWVYHEGNPPDKSKSIATPILTTRGQSDQLPSQEQSATPR